MLTRVEIDAYCNTLLNILRGTGMEASDGREIMGHLFVGVASIEAVKKGAADKEATLKAVQARVEQIFPQRYDEVIRVISEDELAHREGPVS